jgi:predicted MFS family arabinose efflux permease
VFTATNLVTFAVYAALSAIFFFLVLTLQVVAGFSPLQSGAALLPVTLLMLLLSSRMGAVSTRIGPRIPMTVGPLLSSVATVWLAKVDSGASYFADVLPPVALFGLGLSFTVAPLTATVLAAAPDRHAGIASGVNNAVARVAGLLAIAVLPLVVGLDGAAYADPALLEPAYREAMYICAGLLALGGVLAALFVRSPGQETAREPQPPPDPHYSCQVCGPEFTHLRRTG